MVDDGPHESGGYFTHIFTSKMHRLASQKHLIHTFACYYYLTLQEKLSLNKYCFLLKLIARPHKG